MFTMKIKVPDKFKRSFFVCVGSEEPGRRLQDLRGALPLLQHAEAHLAVAAEARLWRGEAVHEELAGRGPQVAARGAAEEDRGAGDAGQDAQGQAEDDGECARGRQEADAAVEGPAQADGA